MCGRVECVHIPVSISTLSELTSLTFCSPSEDMVMDVVVEIGGGVDVGYKEAGDDVRW